MPHPSLICISFYILYEKKKKMKLNLIVDVYNLPKGMGGYK